MTNPNSQVSDPIDEALNTFLLDIKAYIGHDNEIYLINESQAEAHAAIERMMVQGQFDVLDEIDREWFENWTTGEINKPDDNEVGESIQKKKAELLSSLTQNTEEKE